MTFKDIQEFFKSWGLYPALEDTDEYNSDSIFQGMNHPCFNKCCDEAKKLFNAEEYQFILTQINAQDDSYFLRANKWDGMKKAYFKHFKAL